MALLALFGVAVVAVASRAASVHDLLTLDRWTQGLLLYGGFVVAPAGLPATLISAFVAIGLRHREGRARKRAYWAGRGVGFGAALGAIGSAAWFVSINLAAGSPLPRILGLGAALGAICGAAVGLIVGLYCAQVDERAS